MRAILVMDCKERETFWTTLKTDHRIFFASTAQQGLNMLSENIGLVFLSAKLPDMSSTEVLRRIKTKYPPMAVIIITSGGTEETCVEAFGKGGRDCSGRPLGEEILQKMKVSVHSADHPSERCADSSVSTGGFEDDYPNIPPHLVSGVLRVRDFIAHNYFESLTLPAACKMASTSKTYFCRFFKRATGYSLRNYHHMVKIRKAQELLKDRRLSVTDVALKLGYSDSNYFSTIFKKLTGSCPREWQTSYINVYKQKGTDGVPSENKTATVQKSREIGEVKQDRDKSPEYSDLEYSDFGYPESEFPGLEYLK